MDNNDAVKDNGATSIQATLHLGEAAKKLYAFQGTPSTVNVRNNIPSTSECAKQYRSRPRWQLEWTRNFGKGMEARDFTNGADLATDGRTRLLNLKVEYPLRLWRSEPRKRGHQ